MAYFPFMVDIDNWNCLVIGAGKVALRKIKTLLTFDVPIHIVAKEISEEIKQIIERNEKGTFSNCNRYLLEERAFKESDLDGKQMVIVATNDYQLNEKIAIRCKKEKIPVNVVNRKELSSFTFPAMIKEEDILIAISSGGKSPAAVADLKERIKKNLPENYGKRVHALGKFRNLILSSVEDEKIRKELFYKILTYGKQNEKEITDEIVMEMIKEAKKEYGIEGEYE